MIIVTDETNVFFLFTAWSDPAVYPVGSSQTPFRVENNRDVRHQIIYVW